MRLLIYCIFAFVSRGIGDYLDIFVSDWWYDESLVDDTIYWICYFIYWILSYFVPLPILYFILRNISVLDDGIGLRKEVKVIAHTITILDAILLVVIGMYPVIWFMNHDLLTYWGVTDQLNRFLDRLLVIPVNYMQTRWVVRRFGFFLRSKSGANLSDPTAISLSTSKMRRAANDTTLNLVDHGNDSLTPDSEEVRAEMKRTLMKYTAFEAFVRFLLEVCSSLYCKHCASLHLTNIHRLFCTGILSRFFAEHN